MIRARGVCVVIAAVVLFALADSTRVGWLLLFDAVLWGTVLVSAVVPWLAVGGVQVERRTVAGYGPDEQLDPMEGDAVAVEVTVRNRWLLPAMFVNVRYNMGGEPAAGSSDRLLIAWLGGRQIHRAKSTVRFDRRGLYELPPARVETGVPFGLFRRSRRVGAPVRLLVLPRVYPMSRLAAFDGAKGDSSRLAWARTGEQAVGSRGYLPGDPWRHIHWRNTARTGEPQVKEFENVADRSLIVALDVIGIKRWGIEALDDAIRIAASVSDYVCRSRGTVRLLAGGLDETSGSRRRLLERLALLQGDALGDLTSALRMLGPAVNVLAIVAEGPGREPALAGRLAAGQRMNVVMMKGFGAVAGPGPVHEETRPQGGTIVECWPGGVVRALESLSSARVGDRRHA